ncbi:MAG: VOC family protein [Balneolaceae bacterium]|nr:VOC family protein [Balneolaceae bacterium]
MMKNPVNWFEIYVSDMKRARKFYEQVLKIELEKLEMPGEMDDVNTFQMLTFPLVQDEPNSSGALVKAEGVEPGGNSVIIYFTCEDCSTEEGRVEKAGGKVLKNKFSIGPFGFVAICMDTEGNTFGLHSMN